MSKSVKFRVVQMKIHHRAGLGFLVAKRMILINWKTRKKNCFSKETWLLEFFDLLGMERMADLMNNSA